jgi:hypothetical protein
MRPFSVRSELTHLNEKMESPVPCKSMIFSPSRRWQIQQEIQKDNITIRRASRCRRLTHPDKLSNTVPFQEK